MSEENQRPPNDNRQRPGGDNDPQMNWRGLVLFAVAIALIGGAFLFRGNNFAQSETITYPKFLEFLKAGKVVNTPETPLELVVEEGRNTQYLEGKIKQKSKTTGEEVATPFTTPIFTSFNGEEIQKTLSEAGITPSIVRKSDYLASAVVSFLPILLFLVILYFFFRSQIKMAGKGALNFGKSKARMLSKEKNRVTFKDVAGVEEAKDEVQELVEFLKDPKRFQKLGGRIPKGILMVGSPGTGKTLLARAIAGEADVPFFSISGSDFVEMFVGVGASRVRDMFEQGKKSAPCLMFIDEIDAVGRHRGHGLGGGHDEREQTLNQLLVEMDGFDTQDGVIIIAATNRPDVLDPALLRPGRFDRQVTVALPDVKGREEILKVHSKKVKLGEAVDLAVLARGTPGYSGAELANVINEAALLAARKGLKAIGQRELEEARDKVRWGKERRSMAMSEREKISTAWHEAGHALINVLLEHTHPLHKVTIIPRGPYLGATMYLPEGDKYSTQQKEALDLLAVTMGGRIAEEMFTNDVSNGAAGDIRQATSLARRMVCEWGMSSLGMISFTESNDYVFLGRDMGRAREHSEATAQLIDAEVKRIIDQAYERAKKILEDHRTDVEKIAKALLEYETLDASHVKEIIEFGELRNPPIQEVAPPPLPPPPSGIASEPPETIKPELPPGGLGSPAPA
ncbi:MAG: ATP-dependent zinc metalloprotease FtsH [Chthoniobacterales bacterium]|nr:ATP-dependent zinc metalloprotease FtsH [Chthoniobacterales bacterium]